MADGVASLTREWLTKAAHDLQNARIVSAIPDGPLDTAIYHCQQAAEKAVKGWLVWRGINIERTHDIVRLVQLANHDTPELARFEDAAEILTPYSSAFRYPGLTAQTMPSHQEFDDAPQHAQAIYDFVFHRLPAEARP